jgi:signal transduction histidine kinase
MIALHLHLTVSGAVGDRVGKCPVTCLVILVRLTVKGAHSAMNTDFPQAMSLAVHELRTPVTVVSGYLRMLLREQGGPLTDKQRKMLEEADRSCARIGALVAEMSELGKLEQQSLPLGRQSVDLAGLVAEVAETLHEGEDRGVRLELRGTDTPVQVAGDRTRLIAAVKAIMYSALRERGEPGAVVVECVSLTDTTPPWAVVAVGEEDTIPTMIETARGVPPPFDEWRGGLGLALPVGRRVISALDGALWSAPGERPRAGSALRLPLQP